MAYDSSNPSEKATAVVTIAVTRNENSPTFSQRSYSIQATESLALGAFVIQVNATDRDGVSYL